MAVTPPPLTFCRPSPSSSTSATSVPLLTPSFPCSIHSFTSPASPTSPSSSNSSHPSPGSIRTRTTTGRSDCTRRRAADSAVATVDEGGDGDGAFSEELRELLYEQCVCNKWRWRGHDINFLVKGEGSGNPPLLLVHGFGASVAHWRRNIGVLAQDYSVYAIDLLGFGASDKPMGFDYTMEVWSQLILDFLNEVVQRPTVLIGNSVGSLACVIAAAESESVGGNVRGLVLLNCSGGMNNKAIVDDWRIKLLFPLLLLLDFLLKQKVIASALFERVKQRENLRNILKSVYGNKDSVDDDLVEIIRRPADDKGALDAFVSVVTGPPGPNPISLMPKISLPVLVLWGSADPFTPIDGPVGRYFSSLPSRFSNISLSMLEDVGHCPHDDRPELVHEKLLPWLGKLPVV